MTDPRHKEERQRRLAEAANIRYEREEKVFMCHVLKKYKNMNNEFEVLMFKKAKSAKT